MSGKGVMVLHANQSPKSLWLYFVRLIHYKHVTNAHICPSLHHYHSDYKLYTNNTNNICAASVHVLYIILVLFNGHLMTILIVL